MRTAAIVLPALGFLTVLAYGLLKSAPPRVVVGSQAPAFDLPLLSGAGRLSSADLEGSPIVLNFWASWCGPCREEAALLERAWNEYRDEGVVFVGVNVRDARSAARAFVDEFDISYPIVRDEREELAQDLGVYGYPETFFIDHERRFVAVLAGDVQGQQAGTVVRGPVTEAQLLDNVELLIRRAAGARSVSRRELYRNGRVAAASRLGPLHR